MATKSGTIIDGNGDTFYPVTDVSNVAGAEASANKATSLSDASTDTQYPSAKATYDEIHPAVASSQPVGGFTPGVEYRLGALSGSVAFALAPPSDTNVSNFYLWTFSTGGTAPTITWPNDTQTNPAYLYWQGGSAPTINANKTYEVMARYVGYNANFGESLYCVTVIEY